MQPLQKLVRRGVYSLGQRRSLVCGVVSGVFLPVAGALAAGATAPGVLVAPPSLPEPELVPPAVSTNAESSATTDLPPLTGGATPVNNRPLLDWGPVHLHPHLAYQFLVGSGLQAQPGEQTTTIIQTLSPGMLFDLGRYWTLDYTPSLQYYSSSRFQDTLNQAVVLTGATTYQDWQLGLSQAYNSSSSPQIETGGQTEVQSFNTGLSAAHPLNSKLSVDLGLNQNFQFPEQFVSSREWSTMDWVNYQFWPRVGAGLGMGVGYVDLSAGADMLYEQGQGRVSWQPGTKLSLTLSAGIDEHQFIDSGAPSLLNPIFGAVIQYHLFEPTTLSLNASRTISPSYFQSQISESTAFSATLQQRLLGRLQMSINGGYASAQYAATSSQLEVSRSDNYFYFGAGLSCPFLQRGTIGLFYQHSENTSNESGFGFSSDQGGVNLAYRF